MRARLMTYLFIAIGLIGTWHIGVVAAFYSKAWLAESLIDQAWQHTLDSGVNRKPWPWADTWPVAEIQVPRLKVRQIILSGDSGRTLAFGPGLTEAGVLPGEPGLSIISGHRDTNFKFLKYLKKNDTIIIRNQNGTKVLTIVELTVVDQRHFTIDPETLSSNTKHSQMMLVTCYPFDALKAGGNLRFIALAESKQLI